MQKISCCLLVLTIVLMVACSPGKPRKKSSFRPYVVSKTEDQWKDILTSEEYDVLRSKGTERAFTGKYWNTHEQGAYHCAGCSQILFSSDTKFDSGTGWPSFFKPYSDSAIAVFGDYSLGMPREEVVCSQCGGHLGHVFSDGPPPTGLRYCLNSVSLKFKRADEIVP